jgi:hypothetical protein
MLGSAGGPGRQEQDYSGFCVGGQKKLRKPYSTTLLYRRVSQARVCGSHSHAQPALNSTCHVLYSATLPFKPFLLFLKTVNCGVATVSIMHRGRSGHKGNFHIRTRLGIIDYFVPCARETKITSKRPYSDALCNGVIWTPLHRASEEGPLHLEVLGRLFSLLKCGSGGSCLE